MSDENARGGYVNKVRDDTRRYIQELLAENQRLQLVVSSLEDEKVHIAEHLEKQVELLKSEIEHRKVEEAKLKQDLNHTKEERLRFLEQFEQVEEQNSNLANLYVASYRLHGTMDRQQVLDVIQEIVINLIGSEEMGIFEMAENGSTLDLIASFGIDTDRYRTVNVGDGPIGRAALSGQMLLSGNQDQKDEGADFNLTACIPLKLDEKVNGAIVIFGLLPQKQGLGSLDHELFDLLATHAATALFCTSLYAKASVASGV
ncbi:MAG: GAF domain-containing protein [Blastocatellia bacterium]